MVGALHRRKDLDPATATQPVRVEVLGKQVESAQLHRVDNRSANPRLAWEAMGSPAKPSAPQIRALQNASLVLVEQLQVVKGGVALELPPNAAYLLELRLAS